MNKKQTYKKSLKKPKTSKYKKQLPVKHRTHIIHITKEHAQDLMFNGTVAIEPLETNSMTFIISIINHPLNKKEI